MDNQGGERALTLKERLKAKRDKLREKSAQSEALLQQTEQANEESEELVKTLKKRHTQAQKQLASIEKDKSDDGSLGLSEARSRTRQRIMRESHKKEEEAIEETVIGREEVEDEVEEAGETSDKTVEKTPRSAEVKSPETSGARKSVKSHLNESLRKRLTEKIQKAKDKGKDEAYEEGPTSRRLARLRTMQRSTRFDAPDSIVEEKDAEDKLKKSLATRSKWKAAGEKVSQDWMPSVEEQYNFFTMEWEPEETNEEPKPSISDVTKSDGKQSEQKKKEDESDEITEADTEQTKETDEDGNETDKTEEKKDEDQSKAGDKEPLLNEESTEPFLMVEINKAQYVPEEKRLEKESDIYFTPSSIEAPVSERFEENEEPRYLEDEGFFVGEKPLIGFANLNRMENRLLKQKDMNKDWFGEDGHLKTLPNPLKSTPTRPEITETLEPHLKLDYCHPIFADSYGTKLSALSPFGTFMMDVDINTITFSHHHLYSREHVLASTLTELYKHYVFRSIQKTVQLTTDKLKALKTAQGHLQDNLEMMMNDNRDTTDLNKRLSDYKAQIKETRYQRDEQMRYDREVMSNIIETWKKLKRLRTLQNCTNTPIKLIIKKEVTDYNADEAEWKHDIDEELEELREEARNEYNEKLQKYQDQIAHWKKQKLDKKDAKKRQAARGKKKKSKKSSASSLAEAEEEQARAEADEKILEQEDIEKPNKPVPVSEKDLRARIIAKYEQIRRQPGEAKLVPEVTGGATVTTNQNCPRGEQARRSEVNKTKIFIKVLINNKEVTTTPAKPLGQDFTCYFAQIFNVQMVQWPETIKLEIHETSGIGSTKLCELYSFVPETTVTSDNAPLEDMQFSSDVKQSHSHEGIGSGTLFSFEENGSDPISKMTTGNLTMKVSWAVDEVGNILSPPTSNKGNNYYSALKSVDPIAGIGASGMNDMEQLSSWYARSHIDPNDPAYADIVAKMQPLAGEDAISGAMRMPYYLRLEQLQEEFNFVSDEEFSLSRRARLLALREQEVQEFRNYKMVPAFEKEIKEDVFREYEKKKLEEDRIKEGDKMDSHRAAVARFMQRVREAVLLRFKMMAHQKQLSDMIIEEAVPNIGTIIPHLMKITEPRRPLKPVRRERKKMTAQNLQQSDVRILVNIVRAFNIPVRTEALNDGGDPTKMNQKASFAPTSTVQPIIEVMFQRHTESTAAAEGSNPSWNEELRLPFRAPNNDYSTINLQTVKDVLYINVFDEIVVDVVQEGGTDGASATVHRRIEKKWLGGLKIPFSTIYFNSRIDGTFRIEKPKVLLGYQDDPNNSESAGAEGSKSSNTYLTMFVTIEPALAPAEPMKEKLRVFDTNEDEKLLTIAESWLGELVGKYPKREYKAMVIDINGKSVFLTRFFKDGGLRPPEELVNDQSSPMAMAEKVARFVAMIPFVSDSVVFPGACDIWSTCDQFISMLQGDEEEHAVLLANYFLYMGKTTYLLLGHAVPEGPTAYVLTREDKGHCEIWNASTGEHYNYRDNYCPIQSVGCLINHENIWANIQPTERPARISFDLTQGKNWKPFFHKGFPHPGLSSIQPESLLYRDTDREYVLNLQDKIERILKEKIMEWRPRNITRWNRHCIQAFRRILPRLEEASIGDRSGINEQVDELGTIFNSYKMSGFPINMQYTEMDPIIESVFSTGVHNKDTNDIEFAVSVYIHPYPNTVLSVWIYVASLVRKR